MARATIEVMTCDRCGHREEIRRSEQAYRWGKAAYREINGHRWVAWGPGHKNAAPADICPTCLAELHSWWGAPKCVAEESAHDHE